MTLIVFGVVAELGVDETSFQAAGPGLATR